MNEVQNTTPDSTRLSELVMIDRVVYARMLDAYAVALAAHTALLTRWPQPPPDGEVIVGGGPGFE